MTAIAGYGPTACRNWDRRVMASPGWELRRPLRLAVGSAWRGVRAEPISGHSKGNDQLAPGGLQYQHREKTNDEEGPERQRRLTGEPPPHHREG